MHRRRVCLALLPPLMVAVRAAGQEPVGPPYEPLELPVLQVERPTGPVETCVTSECHAKIVGGRFLHGPTAQKRCDACHIDLDVQKHTYQLTVPETELCGSCHVRAERTVVHKPVSDKDCVKCHDPHGTDYPLHLVADPSGPLCLPCHKPAHHGRGGTGAVRPDEPPQTIGACNVCHEYHSSWLPKLLPTGAQQLCLSCHRAMWSQLELVGRVHAPVLDKDCLACHDAHTTRHSRQLREAVPEVCYSCHEHEDIRTLVAGSAVVHGALTTEESCNACHVGHGGAFPGLLAAREMELCLSCHDEPLTTEDGRVLTDLACLFKENPRYHGPIRDGACRPCHDPHASSRRDLLTGAYPDLFYAPFDTGAYALCFECHVEALALTEAGAGATGFRDGDRNLHFVHVNKDRRGRTCLTCHEVHASSRPFHIRETVPFGPRDWAIEINFAKLPNGGVCTPACHDTTYYDRGAGPSPQAPRAGLKPELVEEERVREEVDGA